MILYFYLYFFNYDLFAIYIFPKEKFDGKYTNFFILQPQKIYSYMII